MVSAIRVADVNAGWIRMSGPVKSPEDRPRSPRRGPARGAQCPHERRSGARGEALWAPVGDRAHGRSCSGAFAGDDAATQRWAFEIDTMGAVDDAVENGVGQGGITEYLRVPLFRID